MSENKDFEVKVIERLTKIEAHLERNTDSLEEHMRRTALLESEIERRVGPIESHIHEVNGALKFLKAAVWLAGAVGIVYAAIKVFI